MFRIKKQAAAVVITLFMFLSFSAKVNAQGLPEVFEEGTLEEQFEYLHQRTIIYSNFRAIREDMFRILRRNTLDTLNRAVSRINTLQQQITEIDKEKVSLQQQYAQAVAERDVAIASRDSLDLLGLEVGKSTYNSIMWAIVGALALILLILLVLFNRANSVARQKSREMNELQVEYDEYRKTSRERFERQSIEHFNELKRLRGI
jgi:preprotein translocase subunit SecF